MTSWLTPAMLRSMPTDGLEIALVDVRPVTDFEMGHILLAVNVAADRLSGEINRLLPLPSTRSL